MSVAIYTLSRGFEIHVWLCDEDVERRKAEGWDVKGKKAPPHELDCQDCKERREEAVAQATNP